MMDTTPPAKKRLADDLLEGAEEIADYVYGNPESRRKIYHLVETSRFPFFRLGTVLCARKSKIEEWIGEQERRNWRPRVGERKPNEWKDRDGDPPTSK
jgi:hypothetical protein